MDVEVLRKAVERYNRYRSPEAVARLVKAEEGRFLVEFSGSFCETCGVYDWLEDLVYELKGLDPTLNAEIVSWSWISDDMILAEYKLEKSQRK